jgi:catechol 2,3-dioxygenase-like lactoylglutathione lyase family enzyme
MPRFAGADHVAFSVTDLDVSERFWTQVMGLLTVLDFGTGRLCMDTRTGFTVGLLRHPDAAGGAFTELTTGLDHLGLEVSSREELVRWQEHLEAAGVEHSPIQDMPLGHHLNFRDPDGIALELTASTEVYAAALQQLRSREMSDEEVLPAAEAMLGPEVVARRPRP